MTRIRTMSAETIAKGHLARRLIKEEQDRSRTTLEGGAVVYKDRLPGVGWVLEFRGRKCYMATKELVVDLWDKKYRKDHEVAAAA